MTRLGSLFTGYGGLDLASAAVLGTETVWHCENDPAASRVLAHHHPGVLNLGDITAVEWGRVEPVDVLTGGFPCQDVSSAGMRAGMRAGSRSGLWTHMARAVHVLRPRLVVIENVRGLLSADADSDLEPCAWCLGDDEGRPLRALGAVLGDLATLGYDTERCGLRASDAGAPHERFRVFITAWPAGADPAELGLRSAGRDDRVRPAGLVAGDAANPDGVGPVRGRGARRRRGGPADDGVAAADSGGEGRGPGRGLSGIGGSPADGDSASADAHPEGVGRREGRPEPAGQLGRPDAAVSGAGAAWGDYGPAIRRWEHVLGRVAPSPTVTGKRGGQQLSPAFVEWLMGLPEGHVTAVPGLSRNDQLKLLGNGVVPRQAELALRRLLVEARPEECAA